MCIVVAYITYMMPFLIKLVRVSKAGDTQRIIQKEKKRSIFSAKMNGRDKYCRNSLQ